MKLIYLSIFLLLVLCKRPIKSQLTSKFILTTGSSKSHELPLLYFLQSIYDVYSDITLYIWNLGLSPIAYSYIKKLSMKKPNVYLLNFSFSNYPSYFNIEKNGGQYAWKPVIINYMYNLVKKPLVWLDAGCLLDGSLDYIYDYISKNDVWSVGVSHNIEKFTDKGMLDYYNIIDNQNITKQRCCAGGLVGFMYPSDIAKKILKEWEDCAMHLDCIAPPGSSRANHRQDQSAFSIILGLNNRGYVCNQHRINFTAYTDNWLYKYHDLNQMIDMFKRYFNLE